MEITRVDFQQFLWTGSRQQKGHDTRPWSWTCGGGGGARPVYDVWQSCPDLLTL